jgi:hypothetical protein
MPRAEGNDHVRLLDSQGNTQRTDSVLSPEAIEDADRVGAGELSGLGLALGSADTITGAEVDQRVVPSLSASTTADLSDVTATTQPYSFNTTFDSAPRVFTQWITQHFGVTAHVADTSQGGFEVTYTNATTLQFSSASLAIVYMAISTE